ncbi:MAG: PepSY domain-containing protein [Bacteroidetes bacterium]|nr:PepSY domain-containing protein [Bacteroidota bacterium]
MLKKKILFIHRWLGFISGLVVFIIGLTGALYAYESELRSFFFRASLEVPVQQQPLAHPDTLLNAAQGALGVQYPVSRIEYDSIPGRSILFYSYKYNNEASLYWRRVVHAKVAFVNPYTAAVIKVEDVKWEFFSVVLAIHTSLMMGTVGSYIIGWSTVIFVVLLISGMILWWPKNKSAAKQRFAFRWKKATRFKRKNYDLHNILGFYACTVLVLIALTGLIWSFKWWERSVMKVANGGRAVVFEKPPLSDTTQAFSPAALASVFYQTQQLYPHSRKYMINMPEKKFNTITVVVPGEGRFRYKFSVLYFDRFSNKLLTRAREFKNKPSGEQLRNMNIDLHTGSILGIAGKTIAFLVSLIAASLPVTGFVIWWGKRKKTKPATKQVVKVPAYSLR